MQLHGAYRRRRVRNEARFVPGKKEGRVSILITLLALSAPAIILSRMHPATTYVWKKAGVCLLLESNSRPFSLKTESNLNLTLRSLITSRTVQFLLVSDLTRSFYIIPVKITILLIKTEVKECKWWKI